MKSNVRTRIIAAVFILAIPWSLRAGTESHGGSGVFCKGPPTVAMVLDYYHASLPVYGARGEAPKMIDLSKLSEVGTVNLLIHRLGDRYFARELTEVIRILSYPEAWKAASLKDVDDANEPYILPADCVRKTIAVRQGDHEMFIDPAVADLLAPSQLGVLLLHEAIYYIASAHGATTSEKVRALIWELLRSDMDDSKLDKLIEDIGGVSETGTMFDFLNVTRYLDGSGNTYFFELNGSHGLVLNVERRDGPNEKLATLNCGGYPFTCRGHDQKNANVFLEILDDNSRFVNVRWFFHDVWTESHFTATDKSGH